jgi:acetylornithine deacetylase/succinyl-diaminopimelate desuccinylase-like protein
VLANEHGLPIEIGFVWETEEETGSLSFGEIVAAKREQLRCDGVIVSDTIWPHADQPAISTALRGLLLAELRLRTAAKEVHSGLTGGVARNPIRELCEVASAIHQASFWREGVVNPSPEETEGYASSGFDLEYFKGAHSLEKLETEVPLEIMLRLWARPTFEIHGVTGGYHGPGVKTVVPNAAELKASFRLVAGQDPAGIAARLHEFVAALNPDIEVETTEHLAPYRGNDSGRFHEAISRGMKAAFGREPVVVREGGSIGAVPVMNEALGVPVHFLPLSLPDHGYHAPNEYFDWRQARGGIEAFARTFAELAKS